MYYDFSLSKLSSVTSWLNPLFRIGYKRSLEEEDLYNVLPEFRSKTLGLTLQRSVCLSVCFKCLIIFYSCYVIFGTQRTVTVYENKEEVTLEVGL